MYLSAQCSLARKVFILSRIQLESVAKYNMVFFLALLPTFNRLILPTRV
jgi:hypothetical protein